MQGRIAPTEGRGDQRPAAKTPKRALFSSLPSTRARKKSLTADQSSIGKEEDEVIRGDRDQRDSMFADESAQDLSTLS
jgi:hypothetical protein